MHFRGPLVFLPLLSLGACLSVGAQELPRFPDGRAIVPIESVAAADEGHSFVYNPAGPAFTQPASFEFYQAFVPSEAHAGPGDVGRALFWSLPSLRFGWQYIWTEEGPGRGVFSFSQSRVLGSKFGIGTSLNYFYFLNTGTPLAGNLALNLGMMLRPTRGLSFGLTFANLLSPMDPENEFKTRATFGVGIRPLGDRLTLSVDAGARLATIADDPGLGVTTTLTLEPISGIRLHLTGEALELTQESRQYILGMGMTFRFGRVSIGDQGYLEVGDTPRAASDSFYVATHTKRAPTALTPGGLRGQVWTVTLKDGLEAPPRGGALGTRPYAVPLLYQIQRLRQAIDNPRVKGVLLNIEDHRGSLADMQELRGLIVELRAKGKKAVAYLSQPKARDVYLASVCDKVILHPAGELRLEAPHRDAYYLKGLGDKIGVEAEVERRGAYKSAPESYMAKEPSIETREMNRWLLEDLYQQLVAGISEGRGLPLTEVTAAFEQQLIDARESRTRKLVDELYYPDELEPVLKEVFGRNYPLNEDDESHEPLITRWGPRQKIGVVYVGGAIQRVVEDLPTSLLSDEVVSSREAVEVLKKMEESRAVRAVVVRIDSPGGDVFASDELWNAVRKVQAKKPVIISMAGTAASGGYYMAVPAEMILADPATLTGSIGVYTVKPNAQKLLEKLEVNPHTFTPGTRTGDLYSLHRPWTEEERKRVAASVEGNYQQFMQKVAEGRKMSIQQVQSVAAGRVWTGRQAKEKKLVDELGGLDDALRMARERGGIKPGQTVLLEVWPRRSLQDSLVANVLTGTEGKGLLGHTLRAVGSSVRSAVQATSRPAYKATDLPDQR